MAAIVVLAVGSAIASSGDDGAEAEDKPAADAGEPAGKGSDNADAPAKAPERAKKKADIEGDGMFEVGADVKPGTYRSTGGSLCYWQRSKSADGGFDSIIANENATGQTYVTILASDKYFESKRCGDWERVSDAQQGAPKSSMAGDGMYKVGTDIQPGTYKSTGGSGCYWERSKDALSGMGSILANDNPTGTTIVTISGSDGYFKSNRCGEWKKS
ncbi:hypothetical protein G5C51_20395 [Streptomyces sp. A7024]|uniref:Uncharacterized protein n=1 Tax=Streptomyces coryli TaxID=1128680 RepID=A0A6G4U4N6_9ACTN|nr:hypothetical protein [Streptomyces coryli]